MLSSLYDATDILHVMRLSSVWPINSQYYRLGRLCCLYTNEQWTAHVTAT